LPRLADMRTPLATVPTASTAGGSTVGEAAVVVRMFAVRDTESVSVLPGGIGRVLAPGDDPLLPTACVAKDVWVLGRTTAPALGPRLPQVDFAASVPTRAADALYWSSRAAERAEAMARTARVISGRLEQDPGLAGLHGGVWTQRMLAVAAAVGRRGATSDATADPSLDALLASLDELRA